MKVFMILLAFFIGAICGILPLAFGLLTKNKLLGILGMVTSSGFGILFEIFDKEPFLSIFVAIIFVVFIFAKYKKNNTHHEDDDHDVYMDDE